MYEWAVANVNSCVSSQSRYKMCISPSEVSLCPFPFSPVHLNPGNHWSVSYMLDLSFLEFHIKWTHAVCMLLFVAPFA